MNAQDETKKVKNFIFFVLIPLILYGVGVYKFHEYNQKMDKEILSKKSQINRFFKSGFDVPTDENIAAKLNELKEVKEVMDSLYKYNVHELVQVPSDVSEPVVYFKEQLFLKQKKLKQSASQQEVVLPESIGFDESLPQEDLISLRLTQLEMVNRTLDILIENKSKEVQLVEFQEPKEMKNYSEESMECHKIPLKLNFYCDLNSLKKVMYEIGNTSPFNVIEGLRIKAMNESVLDVSMLVSQFVKLEAMNG